MTTMPRFPIPITDGFYPSQALSGPNRRPNALMDGRNVLFLGPGLMRSAKGLGTGPTGIAGTRLYNVGGIVGTVTGTGSIVPYRGESEWYCTAESTSGIINGRLTHNGTGGRLRYTTADDNEYNAGLAAPTLPSDSLTVPDVDGTMSSGATSVVITRIRTASFIDSEGGATDIFAESNPSEPSNTITFENKDGFKLEFPAAGTGLDEHNAWGVYITPADFGEKGPYLFLRVVLENTIPGDRKLLLQFKDNELDPVNPPDVNDPPPLGEFVAILGNVVIMLNVNGVFFAPSRPGFPEAFNPLASGSLSPAERVLGFTARPAEGELIYWTMNSIGALQLTGNEEQPIQNRAILSDQGIQAAHGLTYGYSRLYGINGPSGPFRVSVNGDPDTSFALPVRDFLRDMGVDPEAVAVGYDPMSASVVYCLGDDTALVYHESLSETEGRPIWSVLIELNAAGSSDVATLTFEGKLVISKGLPINGGGLYYWETGTLNPNWYAVTAWQDNPESMDRKTLIGFRFACMTTTSATVTAKLYLDYADTDGAATATQTSAGTGSRYSEWKRINEKCKNYALRVEGSNADERIFDMSVEMLYTAGIRERVA